MTRVRWLEVGASLTLALLVFALVGQWFRRERLGRELESAVLTQRLDQVRRLLAAGADPNRTLADGRTLLYESLLNRDPELPLLLIRGGAKVNAPDSGGTTPLIRAAEHEHPGFTPVVAELLSRGANPRARDQRGRTPLRNAYRPRIIELLLQHGADANERYERGQTWLMTAKAHATPEIIRILLAHGAQVNLRDEQGKTALTYFRFGPGAKQRAALIAAGAVE